MKGNARREGEINWMKIRNFRPKEEEFIGW
jgi:hypothetical protein